MLSKNSFCTLTYRYFNNMDCFWEYLLSLLQVIWLKEVSVCSCFHNIDFENLGTHCNLDPSADVKNKNLDIHYLGFKMMEHLCKSGSPLVKTVIFFFTPFSFFLAHIHYYSIKALMTPCQERNKVTPNGSSPPLVHFYARLLLLHWRISASFPWS